MCHPFFPPYFSKEPSHLCAVAIGHHEKIFDIGKQSIILLATGNQAKVSASKIPKAPGQARARIVGSDVSSFENNIEKGSHRAPFFYAQNYGNSSRCKTN